MGRTKILLIILLVAACSAAAGWYASLHIQSPADVAMRTAAPAPSLILAAVEKRVLNSNIVTRGTARYGLPQSISVAVSALKPQEGVIATLPKPNTRLQEGTVAVSASGRPVFILQGRIPAYRDLAPGMSGDDVLQLEKGLQRLGFSPGMVDQHYDQDTSKAVARWYQSMGWEPFAPGPRQLADLRALEQAWGEANKRMLEAKSDETIAALALDSARATAAYNDSAARLELEQQTAARYLIVLDPRQLKTTRAAAEARLKLAQSAVEKTILDGEIAIQAALNARQLAEFSTRLEIELVEKLTRELDLAKRRLGFQVPADEIVFLPALPVRVKEIKLEVGDLARGPLFSVTNYQLTIDSALTLNAAPLVSKGMRVLIDEKALGISATGVVEAVAESPGTMGVDGYHIYFSVSVDKTSIPIEGASLRLTIPVKSSAGAVTVVPVSALSLSADGRSRIQVKTDGALEYMEVKPGLSADGFVEVSPVSGKLEAGMQVVIGYDNR